jgi:hypothetical protein
MSQLVAYGIQNKFMTDDNLYQMNLYDIEMKKINTNHEYKLCYYNYYRCSFFYNCEFFTMYAIKFELDVVLYENLNLMDKLYDLILKSRINIYSTNNFVYKDYKEHKEPIEDKKNFIGSIPLYLGNIKKYDDEKIIILILPKKFFSNHNYFFKSKIIEYELIIPIDIISGTNIFITQNKIFEKIIKSIQLQFMCKQLDCTERKILYTYLYTFSHNPIQYCLKITNNFLNYFNEKKKWIVQMKMF